MSQPRWLKFTLINKKITLTFFFTIDIHFLQLASNGTVERFNGIDRIDQIDRIDRIDSIDRIDRNDRIGRIDSIDIIDRIDRVERIDRIDGIDRIDRIEGAYHGFFRKHINVDVPVRDVKKCL